MAKNIEQEKIDLVELPLEFDILASKSCNKKWYYTESDVCILYHILES
jgi:hypothetical protein